jgi:hypothetical protein
MFIGSPIGQLSSMGAEADELTNLSVLGQYLLDIRNKLLEVDSVMRRSPEAAREVGRDLISAWNKYTEIVSTYQGFRALVGLEPEAGLSGVPIVIGGLTIAAAVAIALGLAATAGYLLNRALSAEKNVGVLATAVVKPSTTFTTLSPSGQPIIVSVPGEEGFMDFVKANWIWVAAGVAGILLLPALVRRLT